MGGGLVRLKSMTVIIAALVAVFVGSVAAQTPDNPRIGKWKLKQDAPPPALNIMTYELWGNGGMKVTVESTNREGRKATWTYNTSRRRCTSGSSNRVSSPS